MGRRGEAWGAAQAAIPICFAIVPRVGAAWPYFNAFRLVGCALAVVAILLLGWSALSLGRSLTPFPRPVPNGELVTQGAYALLFTFHPSFDKQETVIRYRCRISSLVITPCQGKYFLTSYA